MKKIIVFFLLFSLISIFSACGEEKILHCDGCGTEIKTANEEMDEDWIIYCEDCEDDLDLPTDESSK